jgi:hypothetical protein
MVLDGSIIYFFLVQKIFYQDHFYFDSINYPLDINWHYEKLVN